RAIIARQTAYDAEERIVTMFERDAQNAKTALSSAVEELSRIPNKVDLTIATENAEALKAIQGALDSWAKDARTSLTAAAGAFVQPVASKALEPFFKGIADWRVRREVHRKQYEETRKRSAAYEETLRQIAMLEARLKE